MTLAEFLLARIAEDEAAASKAGSFTPWSETFQNDNFGHLTIQPARVLSECEAKRRIVEIATDQIRLAKDDAGGWDNWHEMATQTLQALALPYADHESYDERWRP